MSGLPAVPFVLLGDSRRRVLAGHVREAVERWRTGWAAEAQPQLAAEVHDSYMSTPAFRWADSVCVQWSTERGTELAMLWETRSLPFLAGFSRAGTERLECSLERSSLVAELVLEAMHRLVTELLAGARDQLPPQSGSVVVSQSRQVGGDVLYETGCGRFPCVLVTMEEARAAFLVMLSPGLLGSILPQGTSFVPREPLERRLTGAAEQMLTVQQVLGHAYISLADLARLRAGDVIVLEEPLSKGGELVLSGIPIGSTLPGRVGTRRAVRLHAIHNKGRSR